MPADLAAAERFVLTNARLLERHRFAALVAGAPVEPVLATLAAYRNPDGGFGHGLEPDLRGAHSEVAATMHALEVLEASGRSDSPMAAGAFDWIDSIAGPDGGVPFALPATAEVPHAPWMQPDPSASPFTFALAGLGLRAGREHPWLSRAVPECWRQLLADDPQPGYWFKCAIDFVDAAPGDVRGEKVLERFASVLRPDGSVPVPGGTAEEKLTPLVLSPFPGRPSRRLFADDLIAADLDALATAQQDDGGWTFDWLGWSPAQAVEWRGIVTLHAVQVLRRHDRI